MSKLGLIKELSKSELEFKDIKYKSTSHFADKWNVSRSKISQWFLADRLEGAIKPMRDLMIPINTERPTPLKAGRKAIK